MALASQDKYIKGQIFGTDGRKIGNEFQVNTTRSIGGWNLLAPSSKYSGTIRWGIFVTWNSWDDYHGGDAYDVYGQFFDANGEKIGPEFLVNHLSFGEQQYTNAVEVKGGVFVTYTSNDPTGATTPDQYNDQDAYGIMGKLFRTPLLLIVMMETLKSLTYD